MTAKVNGLKIWYLLPLRLTDQLEISLACPAIKCGNVFLCLSLNFQFWWCVFPVGHLF